MLKAQKIDAALFALLFFTFAYFYQGGFSNYNSRFDLAHAIVFDHSLSIDSLHENTIDKAFSGGHYYLEKSPFVSYFMVPVLWVFSSWSKDQMLYFSTLLVVSLLSALSAIFFRKVLFILNPKLSNQESIIYTLAVYTATSVLPYSTVLFSHQIVSSFLVLGFYFALTRRFNLAFLLFGLSAFTEYPTVLLVGGIAIYFLKTLTWKQRVSSVSFFLIPSLFLGIHNWICFGRLFSLGYSHLQNSQFAEGMSKGFFGIQLPTIEVLAELLFGSYRGFFVYNPLLIVALVSFIVWPTKLIKKYASILSGCFALLLLNAGYYYWQGGTCFGPRHLVPAIPFLGLGLAYYRNLSKSHWLLILFVALGLIVNGNGTVVTPFLEEKDTRPLATYFDLLKSGKVSISPNQVSTPMEEQYLRWKDLDSYSEVSWNLGEKAGLSGWVSLLPLLLIWIAALTFIFSSLHSMEALNYKKRIRV